MTSAITSTNPQYTTQRLDEALEQIDNELFKAHSEATSIAALEFAASRISRLSRVPVSANEGENIPVISTRSVSEVSLENSPYRHVCFHTSPAVSSSSSQSVNSSLLTTTLLAARLLPSTSSSAAASSATSSSASTSSSTTAAATASTAPASSLSTSSSTGAVTSSTSSGTSSASSSITTAVTSTLPVDHATASLNANDQINFLDNHFPIPTTDDAFLAELLQLDDEEPSAHTTPSAVVNAPRSAASQASTILANAGSVSTACALPTSLSTTSFLSSPMLPSVPPASSPSASSSAAASSASSSSTSASSSATLSSAPLAHTEDLMQGMLHNSPQGGDDNLTAILGIELD